MDKLKKYFDDFTLKARVMPACITIIPLILFGLFKRVVNQEMFKGEIYLTVIIITLTLLSYIARNAGKHYESKMIKRLGALPTTILLMFSDSRVDKYTKIRYHRALKNELINLDIPMSLDEEKKCDAKEVYSSSINWLRNYANANKEKYPLVYQELIKYNFWRNLYGLKFIGIAMYILVAIREVIIAENFNIEDIFIQPYPEYISFIIMIISIAIMIFVVTEKNVEERAFEYGKALLEVCEHLDNENCELIKIDRRSIYEYY